MGRCPSCGEENPERAKFCWNCATPLKDGAPPVRQVRQVRKTVTVLFCDVTGSTALGERLDPESLRAIMGRYFAIAKLILERHGGTVEKFIGDAVMAVFGIPALHEDDALRAVRAAAELRDALRALDQALDAEQGVVLSVRIGVDTGEVVAGDPSAGQTLVTGDAVNTAARLETAAKPAEILIGATTFGLVRDAVQAEPVEPLSLKGKGDAVAAYRLQSVTPGAEAHTRRLDAPMVGRDRELARLRQAYEQAVADRAPQLFTVMGAAGVGKSRLVAEFLTGVRNEASVLSGRCLPYGEGITYWPIGEIVREAAGISDQDSAEAALAKVREVVSGQRDADIVAGRVASAIGLSVETASQEELFWAVRKWLESIAAQQRVVVVLEDVHWAEPTLLDLIEHIGDWSRDVSLLVLCAARPELLDARPGWSGGKLNATSVLLEPLGAEAVIGLIEHLPEGSTLPSSLLTKIVEAADGNPLFVEEMLAMLRDDARLRDQGGNWVEDRIGAVSVPPSISALLAARLDQLGAPERGVAERASVVGRVFDRTAVDELSPEAERATVGGSLLSLVRKELLRPDRSDLTGDEAFKFRHILIRDAAYDALPKLERAELHERFADWLERVAGERLSEYEEIVGHHLEQAHAYRIELRPNDEAATRLAARAGARLGAAGRRAVQRGDLMAATNLLQRSVSLLGIGNPSRSGLLVALIEALIETGRLVDAAQMLEQTQPSDGSRASKDLDARLKLQRAWLQWLTHPENVDTTRRLIDEAFTWLERAGDEEGLAQAWRLRGNLHWTYLDGVEAADCWRKSLDYAVKSGNPHDQVEAVAFLTTVAFHSGMPVSEGLRLCQELLPRALDHPGIEPSILVAQAGLEAMKGRFDVARKLRSRAKKLLVEFGLELFGATTASQVFGIVDLLADNPRAAESELRRGYEILDRMGERSYLSTTACLLAEALFRSGRIDEAGEFTRIGEEAAGADDLATQVPWRSVRAKILAVRGEVEAARSLAAEALERGRGAEDNLFFADALVDQAEVLITTGSPAEALPVLRRARTWYEAKGNVVSAKKTRALLEEAAAG
jgi:class 3 adenylate cyclase/tetratricopeptide (TPR) repeat protein